MPIPSTSTVPSKPWHLRDSTFLRKALYMRSMMRKRVHVAFGVLKSGKMVDPTLHAA